MSSSKNGNSGNFTYYSTSNSSDTPPAAKTAAAAFYQYNGAASTIHSDEDDDNDNYYRRQRNTFPYDQGDYHDPTTRYSSLRAEYEDQYLYQYHRPMDEYSRPMVSSVSVDHHLVNQSPIKWSVDESEKIQFASRKRLSDADLPTFVSGGASSSVSSSYCSDRKIKAGKMIEVSPGQYLRLRGAEETWKAIHRDFFMPCACLCCNLTIFCIQDADCVLCPICKTINPMDYANGDGEGGVGLGFTMDDLKRWQDEMDCSRKLTKNQQFCYR